MTIRDWSGGTIGVVWLIWALVFNALLGGPTLVRAWRDVSRGDTVFLVVHDFAWLLYFSMLVGPPLVVTLLWYRGRAS